MLSTRLATETLHTPVLSLDQHTNLAEGRIRTTPSMCPRPGDPSNRPVPHSPVRFQPRYGLACCGRAGRREDTYWTACTVASICYPASFTHYFQTAHRPTMRYLKKNPQKVLGRNCWRLYMCTTVSSRLCVPLFRISETAGGMELKVGMLLETN